MGQYDELLKMLQTYSSGQASVNQGLINFQNAEKGAKTNQIINDGINTGITAGMQYFQGMNNPSLNLNANQMGMADAISTSALSMASKIPGPTGVIGSVLSLGNQIGGQLNSFKKGDMTKAKVFDETSAWGGLSTIQNQNVTDMQNFNTKGFIGQLFGNKKQMGRNQSSLRLMGKKAANISMFNQGKKNDALSSGDSLNQQNALINSGFNYDDMQFGKLGMKMEAPVMDKPKVLKSIYPHQATDQLKKDSNFSKRDVLKKMSIIYDTQNDLRKQIKEIEKLVSKKIEIKAEGGPINVIVDGLLHAQKHAIKTTLEFKDANITLKGIPVILLDGGEIEQVLEVERDELILHLDLTKKMEELMKDGSEQAMIEAGKILSKEIVKNTKDNKNKLLKNE